MFTFSFKADLSLLFGRASRRCFLWEGLCLGALFVIVACSPRPGLAQHPAESTWDSLGEVVQRARIETALVASGSELALIELFRVGDERWLERYRLSNGFEVLLLEQPSAPLLACQLWLRVGSRDDLKGRGGSAHISEHLMFRQRTATGVPLDEHLEGLGITIEAETWLDHTHYSASLFPEQLSATLAFDALRFQELKFSSSDFVLERAIVLSERGYRIDHDPQGVMVEALYRSAFPEHPYGRPPLGERASIKGLDAEAALQFHRRHHHPARGAVVLVGPLNRVQIFEEVQRQFGALVEGSKARSLLPSVDPKTSLVSPAQKFSMPVETEMLLMGFSVPPIDHLDHAALEVLNEALFAPQTGYLWRLFQRKMGLSIEFSGWVGAFQGASLFEVMTVMKPGLRHELLKEHFFSVLEEISQKGLPDGYLHNAQRLLSLEHARRLQDVDSIAAGVGHYWATNRRPELFFSQPERWQVVNPGRFQEVLKKYLVEGKQWEIITVPSVLAP